MSPLLSPRVDSSAPGELIAIDPAGQRALLRAGTRHALVDLTTGRATGFDLPEAAVLRQCWSPDGDWLALRLDRDTPALLSAANGEVVSAPLSRALGETALVSPPSVAIAAPRLAVRVGRALQLFEIESGTFHPLDHRANVLPPAATPVLDPAGERVAFRDADQATLVVLDLATGRWTQRREASPERRFDLIWSPSGQRLTCAGTLWDLVNGEVYVAPPPDDEAEESLDWLADDELLALRTRRTLDAGGHWVAEQRLVRLSTRFEVVETLVTSRELADPIVPVGFSALRWWPSHAAVLLSHHQRHKLFRISLEERRLTTLAPLVAEPRALAAPERVARAFEVAPRALPAETRRREVPGFDAYVHQRLDVPDWFDGDWACGPASCVILAAHFGKLPRWPVEVSHGGRHTSAYGAYIPGLWCVDGQRFSDEQVDPKGNRARGAYSYICPPGSSFVAADWGRMEMFLRLNGLEVQPNLANVDGLDWDVVWARLVEQVDQDHACLVSVTLRHPNGRTIEHIFVAAGYVVYADGTRAMICKDPYGNWTGVGQAGGGLGGGDNVRYVVNRSGQGAPAAGLIRVKFIRGVWRAAPRPQGVVLDDSTGAFTRYGPVEVWQFASSHGLGSPGRPLPPGPASGMWWAPSTPFGPWKSYAIWQARIERPGRYRLFAFVPSEFATTTAARYFLAQSANGTAPPPPLADDQGPLPFVGEVVQARYNDEWVPVGDVSLTAGWTHVYLSNVTGETDRRVGFDAVRLDSLQ
ncbi:MAG: C39 family peptidase [Ardenticatenaceae bacterium]|nr:C39 family peptidase [Ardenticatenaceae bacterium]